MGWEILCHFLLGNNEGIFERAFTRNGWIELMLSHAWKYFRRVKNYGWWCCFSISTVSVFLGRLFQNYQKSFALGTNRNSSKSFFQVPKNCWRRQRIFLSCTELEFDFFDSYFISKTCLNEAQTEKWKATYLFSKTKTMHFVE